MLFLNFYLNSSGAINILEDVPHTRNPLQANKQQLGDAGQTICYKFFSDTSLTNIHQFNLKAFFLFLVRVETHK